MRVSKPYRDSLKERCSGADSLLISAPFYSGNSLDWVRPKEAGSLEFWTRLNPYDWARGVADPESLLVFLEEIGPAKATLRVHRSLHAKIFLVDQQWAWVGSPNLSIAAFHRNIEIICEFEEPSEVEQIVAITEELRPQLAEL